MIDDDLNPPLKYYGFPVFFVIVGVASIVFFSFNRISDSLDDMVQLKAPGAEELVLQAKSYLIFHETSTVYKGKGHRNMEGAKQFDLAIVSLDNGEKVKLEKVKKSQNYKVWGRAGDSIFLFKPSSSGAYRVTATAKKGSEKEVAIFAISDTSPSYALALLLTDALIGIVVVIYIATGAGGVIYIMRKRSRGDSEGAK